MMPLSPEEVEATALLTVPGQRIAEKFLADACIRETRLEDLLSPGWHLHLP